jgi:7,8-dihydropterin-6-yl-methyl-4-(beta-D-ribofuranosyl)aminobenzene 5'-phosphate synthase
VCDDGAVAGAGRALPRAAPGVAVDPVALEPVDAVEITTLVDNVFDALPDAWLPGSSGSTFRLAS